MCRWRRQRWWRRVRGEMRRTWRRTWRRTKRKTRRRTQGGRRGARPRSRKPRGAVRPRGGGGRAIWQWGSPTDAALCQASLLSGDCCHPVSHVTVTNCHSDTLSQWHAVTLSQWTHCHSDRLSHCNSDTLSQWHAVTVPVIHGTSDMLSHCHSDTLSQWHSVTLSQWYTVSQWCTCHSDTCISVHTAHSDTYQLHGVTHLLQCVCYMVSEMDTSIDTAWCWHWHCSVPCLCL